MPQLKRRAAQSEDLGPASPRKKKRQWTQLHLDFGQRDAHNVTCATCGMVYGGGPSEATLHARFHAKRIRPPLLSPKLAALRPLNMSLPPKVPDARILALQPAQAARALQNFVARVLGVTSFIGTNNSTLAMAFVAAKGRSVLAYALAERVELAHRATVGSQGVVRAEECVKRPLCGVRLLWVEQNHRGKGLATAVVEAARKFLVYAHVFRKEDVAFTAPTSDGARFALRYGYGSRDTKMLYEKAQGDEQNDLDQRTILVYNVSADGNDVPKKLSNE